mmetsp:Transcript_50727/g.111018  ORF Transcript_50727/g.111018 Transcript_50727/m.111018 type:complete len:227 (-) Transcript_50727:140-820(-)
MGIPTSLSSSRAVSALLRYSAISCRYNCISILYTSMAGSMKYRLPRSSRIIKDFRSAGRVIRARACSSLLNWWGFARCCPWSFFLDFLLSSMNGLGLWSATFSRHISYSTFSHIRSTRAMCRSKATCFSLQNCWTRFVTFVNRPQDTKNDPERLQRSRQLYAILHASRCFRRRTLVRIISCKQTKSPSCFSSSSTMAICGAIASATGPPPPRAATESDLEISVGLR